MFEIRGNGRVLDVYPGTRITFTMNNPALDPENLDRIYSFPLSVPKTPNNQKFFNFFGRLDYAGDKKRLQVQLYIAGNFFDEGTLLRTGKTNKSISISYQSNSMAVIEEMDKVKLNESMNKIEVPQNNTSDNSLEVIAVQDPNASWYMAYVELAIPIIPNNSYQIVHFSHWVGASDPNPNETIALEIVNQINYYNFASATYIGNGVFQTNGLFPKKLFNVAVLDPSEGYPIVEQNFREYLQLIYNQATLEPVEFPTLRVENESIASVNRTTYKNGTLYISQNSSSLIKSGQFEFTPLIQLKHMLLKAVEKVQLDFVTGDLVEDDYWEHIYHYSTRSLSDLKEYIAKVWEDGELVEQTRYINIHQQIIDLNEHVPQISVKQFLINIAKIFNQAMLVQDGTLVFFSNIKQMKSDIVDWTSKSEEDYSSRVDNEDGYYINMIPYGDDQITGNVSVAHGHHLQLNPITKGSEEHQIELPYSTLFFMDNVGTRLPYSKEKLGSSQSKDLILLNYFKFQPNENNDYDYPFATHGYKDIQDNDLEAWSFDLNEDRSIYTELHEGFTNVLANAEEIDRTFRLSVGEIAEIRRWKAPLRYIYSEDGMFTGLIKSVRVTISDTEIKPSKITFLKI